MRSSRPAHRRVDDARDQRVRAYAAVLELAAQVRGYERSAALLAA
jgi:hypothetical protein